MSITWPTAPTPGEVNSGGKFKDFLTELLSDLDTVSTGLDSVTSTANSNLSAISTLQTDVSTLLGVSVSGTILTEMIIADGAALKNATGPSVVFDETNGYLEITGCDVGVGTSTPGFKLHIGGAIGIECSGVDGTFQDILSSVYTGNHDEQNAIQASTSSVADSSGFIFLISDGGGSANQTVSYRMSRATHRFYIGGTQKVIIDSLGNFGVGLTPTANMVGLSIEQGVITTKETTAPTADADYFKWFGLASDHRAYFQDDTGNNRKILYDGVTVSSLAISSASITQLSAGLDANNQAITNINIDSGNIDGVTIATSSITVGAGKTLNVASGTLTLAGDQISGDKVHGGTISGAPILDFSTIYKGSFRGLESCVYRMINDESAGNQDPLGAGGSDWEITDDLETEYYLGAVSQVTETSGIFSFGTTGYWLIYFFGEFYDVNIATGVLYLYATDDNSNYTLIAQAKTLGGGNTSTGLFVLLKISDISNDKIKLTQYSGSGAGFFTGSGTTSRTAINFIKLADL
jgi:hypothetical protein